ncbi:DNA repair protein rad16 [Leucoagaricus sp. SymC.cos]|nr:DNA repair protein rad16 [Leucoagaricus sp. SymC.cos]
MSTLLPFHKSILEEIHDPTTSDLLVLARGLGLRRIICTLMKIYDSNKNLVLLVNASPEEESAIGEELGIIGCRRPGLRVVGYETPSRERQELYKQGGLISVTSRILVVDMLQEDIPVHLITGMLILHAERITPLVNEAFIVRLYREKNRDGFIKAFSDQPEHITSGMSPLKNIMKELQLRRVHLYPRFHEHINKTLERRRADVVELSQPLSDSMSDIHHAIIQCMTTTLTELKRSNTNLDLDDLNVENAYFRSFDAIVRYQLASVWHKVGPKTKQLINDLNVLRQLLFYLLSYDSLSFHAYLETILESNTLSASGTVRVHQSPWLLTDAANMIFEVAKRRCFTLTALSKEKAIILPPNIQPMLEEQPKWDLLSDILLEIESETIRFQSNLKPGRGRKGAKMMQRRLKGYLGWRGRLGNQSNRDNSSGVNRNGGVGSGKGKERDTGRDDNVSDALKRKDREKAERSAGRRRVRGGAPANNGNRNGGDAGKSADGKEVIDVDKTDDVMTLWSNDSSDPTATLTSLNNEIDLTLLTQSDFESAYGLLPADQTIVIRAYSDDTDDRMLAEIQPRFVIMFEPCVEFIRRIEARTMMLTLEERRDPGSGTTGESAIKTISTRLAGGRRELSKEPAKIIVDMREFRSTLPSLLHAASIYVVPATLTVGDYILTPDICVERKSLSDLVQSFNSGRLYTQCELMSVHYKHPVLLIEFEEDKAFSLEIISEMKSYTKPTQKYPKKPSNRPATYGASANDPTNDPGASSAPTIQSKLVLLTLSFPRLRIIWSSSPYATAEIFTDLKTNQAEPDPVKAIVVGADGDPDVGKGMNAVAEELLRTLPGIGGSVVGAVMRRCKSVKELCELSMEEVNELVGVGPGKALYEFLHKGE